MDASTNKLPGDKSKGRRGAMKSGLAMSDRALYAPGAAREHRRPPRCPPQAF